MQNSANLPTPRVPGVWYDLASHIGAAYDTACVVREIAPSYEGMTDDQRRSINQMIGMMVAVETLLDLAQKEADQLELEIKALNRPC